MMPWYIDNNDFATTSTLKSIPNTPVTEIIQLLVLLAWTYLNTTTQARNPIFNLVFFPVHQPSLDSSPPRPFFAVQDFFIFFKQLRLEVDSYRLSKTMGHIPTRYGKAVLRSKDIHWAWNRCSTRCIILYVYVAAATDEGYVVTHKAYYCSGHLSLQLKINHSYELFRCLRGHILLCLLGRNI